jgi:hypothetical protein
MSRKQLSHLSDEATQQTNTTGVTTSILDISPDQGVLFALLQAGVKTGAEVGLPIFADLRDSNDDPLPVDTALMLCVDRPTDDEPVPVSVKEDNIAAWNGLSVSEQRNEENIDSVKINIKGGRVNVRDKDSLQVALDGSTQIDWSNSELYFAREGVEEESFDG